MPNDNPSSAGSAGFVQEPIPSVPPIPPVPPVPPVPPIPPVPQPVKARRVGTATLGLALIMIGVLIPLMMFFPEYALPMIRMAPLVLLVLGVEILFYALTWKQGKLKYDGLSIFMAIAITFCSLTASAVLPLVQSEVQYQKLREEKSNAVYKSLREVLDTLDYSGDFDVWAYPSSGGSHWSYVEAIANSGAPEDWSYSVNVDLRASGKSDITPEQAANTMLPLLKELESFSGVERIHIELDAGRGNSLYSLNESRNVFRHLNQKDLLERIEVTTAKQRNAVYTEEEYEQHYQAGFEAGQDIFAESEEANRLLENAYNEGYHAGQEQGVPLEEHNRMVADAYAEGYEAGRNETE